MKPVSSNAQSAQTFSLGETQVMKGGRTIGGSHDRLLARKEKRKAAEGESMSEIGSSGRSKRVKFDSSVGGTSVGTSPHSTGSSQGSSLNTASTEPVSMRPPSDDEPFTCLLDSYIQAHDIDTASTSNQSVLQLMVPTTAASRTDPASLITDEIVDQVSDTTKVNNAKGSDDDDDDDQAKSQKKLKKKPINAMDESPPWKCTNCGADNDNDDSFCKKCNAPRTAKDQVTSSWGSTFANLQKGWKCNSCLITNPNDADTCISCEAPKNGDKTPPVAGDSGKPAAGKESDPSKTPSGTIGPKGFSFPVAKPKSTESASGPKAPDSSKSPASFGGAGFTFNGNANQTPAPSPIAGGFSFTPKKDPVVDPKSSADAPPEDPQKATGPQQTSAGFSFGAPGTAAPSQPEEKETKPKQAFVFGAPSNGNGASFAFGNKGENGKSPKSTDTLSKSSNAPPGPSSGFALATPLSDGEKSFPLATAVAPQAESKPTASVTQTTTTASSSENGGASSSKADASNDVAKRVEPSKPTFTFGAGNGATNENESQKATLQPAFTFGATASHEPKQAGTSAGAPAAPFQFGNSSNSSNIPAFGKATETSKPHTNAFGTETGKAPVPAFGQSAPNAAAPSFGQSQPSAGQPGAAPSAGFTFGANKNTGNAQPTSGFGAATSGAGVVQTAGGFGAASGNGMGGSGLGVLSQAAATTTPASSFGAGTTATAPTPGFGVASTTHAPTPGFGGATSAPGFGGATNGSTPGFGGATSTTAPAPGFGAAPLFGAPKFQATPQPTSGGGMQTAGFGAAPPQAFGAAVPQTFGAAAPQAFGAAPAADGGGGFNMGAGGSNPRRRRIVKAKRPKG